MKWSLLSILILIACADLKAQRSAAITDQIDKADSLCRQAPSEDAKRLFLPIIQQCKKTGDEINESIAWQYLSINIRSNQENIPFRIHCYQNALVLERHLNNHQSELDVLRNLADLHLQQRNFHLAEKELFQIIDTAQKPSHQNLLFATDLLSALYTIKADYHQALSYALKTEKMMQTAEDSSHAITFFGRISRINKDLGNTSEYLSWAYKAFYYSVRKKDYGLVANIRGSIVTGLIEQGKPKEALSFILNHSAKSNPPITDNMILLYSQLGDCYTALDQYKLAELNYMEMLRLMNEKLDNSSILERSFGYYRVGQFYLCTKKPNKAKSFLLKSLKGFKIDGSPIYLKGVFLALFKADSTARDFTTAIRYLQQSNKYNDIIKSDKNKLVQELQIAYHADLKDRSIRKLQDESRLRDLKLVHTKNIRNWTISGACLMMVIACLLFRQYRISKNNSAVISCRNKMLQQLISAREWLLKEVHHRVKNNLHTVICLLESQARYLEDDALKAVENSQHRISAMSLIHQKLYHSDHIKAIDMAEYVPELVGNLGVSFGVYDSIRFPVDIDPITLNLSYAVPLGLIINEAVTNAIKYAFPGKGSGTINISLKQNDQDIVLVIADDGVGLPDDPNRTKFNSFGIELMKGLSEDINGAIQFEIIQGTRITVSFKPYGLPGSEADKRAFAVIA
ncbi:sensor histidine kinase [Mucilaginibacter sp. BJC16-A38]|uniref:tetratricopeptide repeat-containing sensor histidine kinase n=1 Tax=Mucilaginibacter phenanthrenivorans TaxID=1234842 RepID=UPI002158991A|nr:sensor histidine kinase [Mucilaginibacter phenanthrenivorans]MCR8557297.1 sensor histidine kinase [Mucilaginibacter phenanthrenivorans]